MTNITKAAQDAIAAARAIRAAQQHGAYLTGRPDGSEHLRSLPSLDWWKLLPKGATKCPKDNAPLHWKVFGGMRVRRQTNRGGDVYSAVCPTCRKPWDVLAPKERT